ALVKLPTTRYLVCTPVPSRGPIQLWDHFHFDPTTARVSGGATPSGDCEIGCREFFQLSTGCSRTKSASRCALAVKATFSIFCRDLSELTILLTRCNKANCDTAESGEFTRRISMAFLSFS